MSEERYRSGWLTGHKELDKALLRAYQVIPEKDMAILRGKLEQVRVSPTKVILRGRGGKEVAGAVDYVQGTVRIWVGFPHGPEVLYYMVLHELAHLVDFWAGALLHGIDERSEESGPLAEWSVRLRLADWGYPISMQETWPLESPPIPTEKQARKIAHGHRSRLGRLMARYRRLPRGAVLPVSKSGRRTDPEWVSRYLNAIRGLDRLFDLWGYKNMNPKFISKMMEMEKEIFAEERR